ncbi:permease [Pseudomonas lijiangensis]|uniref:Permease n=1 Tax=Pseudomonas lijiangensis TaxID=2995658 RepID=A0ABX8HRL6_9PSED|nr:permease [Pseudomonas lijiangensis]MBX8503139.1 permease [Pseudomonas lijiangensis]MBX8508046.1 permease [Pseudomonas lijiangensis]QWU82752.1 permease [Pseudomonas lijiangensis]
MHSEKKASLIDTTAEESVEYEKVFEWSIKTMKSPPKEVMEGQLVIFLVGTVWILFITWLSWGRVELDVSMVVACYVAFYSYVFYLILVFRQKTVFNYSVTSQKALLEYYDYYPDFAGPLFKGIAIFAILFFLGVALFTGSLLFLVGPAAMSLGAARTLLNWKNPIHHRETRPWDMHNFVTLDRKRSIIVIHCTDITTGFVAHLPNKDLFEQYLQFLHSVLPPTAEYMEKDWEW